MDDRNRTGPEERFEAAWKAWLDRPIGRPPGSEWLDRAHLENRRRRRRLWFPLAAAAILVLAFLLFPKRGTQPPQVASVVGEVPTLGQGEVLIWLDEKTPLYMTFEAPPQLPGGKK